MRTLYYFLLVLFFVVSIPTLSGCKGGSGGGGDAAENQLLDNDADLNHILDGSAEKISIMDATSQQLETFIVDCKGNNKDKICVAICHRPPGNPGNSKDKILPLQATLAHLNHGGNHHSEKDYLGPCQAEDQSEDDGTSDDGESDSDDGDQTAEDGDTGADDPVSDDPPAPLPAWCEEFVELDGDCDGFADETGEPMYQ